MRKPPEPLHDRTALERDLLTAVDGRAGLQIASTVEEHYGRLRDSTVYDAIERMIDDGLINKEPTNRRGHAYTLTEKGRDALTRDLEWRVRQMED